VKTVAKDENGMFDESELNYIEKNLIDLGTIVKETGVDTLRIVEWADASTFPDPTYRTSDGRKWYPRYVAILVKRSMENNTSPKDEFIHDATNVLNRPSYVYREGKVESVRFDPSDIEKMWLDFKSGLYGACLKKPDPKNILSKGEIISRIEELVNNPRQGDGSWEESLKRYVKELDKIEAPFTDYDRARFGGKVSRDLFITAVKEKYPELFS